MTTVNARVLGVGALAKVGEDWNLYVPVLDAGGAGGGTMVRLVPSALVKMGVSAWETVMRRMSIFGASGRARRCIASEGKGRGFCLVRAGARTRRGAGDEAAATGTKVSRGRGEGQCGLFVLFTRSFSSFPWTAAVL